MSTSTEPTEPLSHENIDQYALKAWASTTVSENYEKMRPEYNADSVEFLLEKIGALKLTHSESEPFTIVELGAGTGKFTRVVLRVLAKHSVNNVKIISTEPLKEMCDKFHEVLPNTEIIQRRADDLGLPSNYANAILAATCLHWFSNAESFREIHRVLKPNGILGVIWNSHDCSVSWIKALNEKLDVIFKEKNIPHPEVKDWHLKMEQNGGFGSLNSLNESEHRYEYNLELDLTGMLNLYKSFSVISAAENTEKDAFLSEIVKEMKNNPDVKNKEKYTFKFVTSIEWVQKLES